MPKIQDVLHHAIRPAVAHDRPKGFRPSQGHQEGKMKNRINLYSAVGMKCCHIAYHENHEGIFLVCGRQLTQWRGDDGKPLCKTCKRAARKPETPARRSNNALYKPDAVKPLNDK
jgi:hypothetical protein